MITKHTKPSAQNQNGGIVHQEAPIDISNLMYVHNGKQPESVSRLKEIRKFVSLNLPVRL